MEFPLHPPSCDPAELAPFPALHSTGNADCFEHVSYWLGDTQLASFWLSGSGNALSQKCPPHCKVVEQWFKCRRSRTNCSAQVLREESGGRKWRFLSRPALFLGQSNWNSETSLCVLNSRSELLARLIFCTVNIIALARASQTWNHQNNMIYFIIERSTEMYYFFCHIFPSEHTYTMSVINAASSPQPIIISQFAAECKSQ